MRERDPDHRGRDRGARDRRGRDARREGTGARSGEGRSGGGSRSEAFKAVEFTVDTSLEVARKQLGEKSLWFEGEEEVEG